MGRTMSIVCYGVTTPGNSTTASETWAAGEILQQGAPPRLIKIDRFQGSAVEFLNAATNQKLPPACKEFNHPLRGYRIAPRIDAERARAAAEETQHLANFHGAPHG
jgi:hypothetical protein